MSKVPGSQRVSFTLSVWRLSIRGQDTERLYLNRELQPRPAETLCCVNARLASFRPTVQADPVKELF